MALADGEKLTASLVLDQDRTIEEADRKELTVRRPVTGNTFGWSLGLVDTLTIRHPEPKVDACARCQGLQDWVEAQGLNLLIVSVLEQALSFCRPDDDSVVGATRCKPLAVF